MKRLLWAILFGSVGQGAILWWSSSVESGSAEGAALPFLAASLGLAALFVLFVESMDSKHPNRAVLLGGGLSLVVSCVLGKFLLPDPLGRISWVSLSTWLASQSVSLFVLAWVRRLATQVQTDGLEVLVLGMLLASSTFLLNGLLTTSLHFQTIQTVLDWSMGLCPWTNASQAFLDVDVFKVEAIYREFRVGENLYGWPTVGESAKMHAMLAGTIASFGVLMAIIRRLARRIWTFQP